MSARLRVTLRRSTVGTKPSARGTVRALGLRRIGQSVELPDDPAVRGQVRAVRYLVDVEEMAPAAAPAGRHAARPATTRKKSQKKPDSEEAAS